jgi:hypothetical protein
VFCRVRPLLPDDGPAADMVVSFPSSTDALGRGVELAQSGIYTSFFPLYSVAHNVEYVSCSVCAYLTIRISSLENMQGRSTRLHLTKYLITRLHRRMFSQRFLSWYKVHLMGTR